MLENHNFKMSTYQQFWTIVNSLLKYQQSTFTELTRLWFSCFVIDVQDVIWRFQKPQKLLVNPTPLNSRDTFVSWYNLSNRKCRMISWYRCDYILEVYSISFSHSLCTFGNKELILTFYKILQYFFIILQHSTTCYNILWHFTAL